VKTARHKYDVIGAARDDTEIVCDEADAETQAADSQ